jgi:hypothetical protein
MLRLYLALVRSEYGSFVNQDLRARYSTEYIAYPQLYSKDWRILCVLESNNLFEIKCYLRLGYLAAKFSDTLSLS